LPPNHCPLLLHLPFSADCIPPPGRNPFALRLAIFRLAARNAFLQRFHPVLAMTLRGWDRMHMVSDTRSLKVRVYPHSRQKRMLRQWLGCTRLVYNMVVEDFQSGGRSKQKFFRSELKRRLGGRRVFICRRCSVRMDRDINGAKRYLTEGCGELWRKGGLA
jgi:hypothetical protein